MADFSNTSWVEQSTGVEIAIGAVNVIQRECPYRDTFDGPILMGTFDFRTYPIDAVAGSTLFAETVAWDEQGLDGYVERGILIPVPTAP
tara:strand:+ start:31 stop:297 length:267 start_codon:yes stop_codon:yes gene_type:complete